jgi:hypothetical protein
MEIGRGGNLNSLGKEVLRGERWKGRKIGKAG